MANSRNLYIKSVYTGIIREIVKENDLMTVNKIRQKIAEYQSNQLKVNIETVTPPHSHTIKELCEQLVKEKIFFKQVGTGARGSNVYGVRTR
jgi:hypothetical protein